MLLGVALFGVAWFDKNWLRSSGVSFTSTSIATVSAIFLSILSEDLLQFSGVVLCWTMFSMSVSPGIILSNVG